MKRFSILLATLILSSLLGCGETHTSDGMIGVSLLTMTNPFFCDMAEAMKEEAAKHNFTVIITAGEFDPARQKDQVEDFIVKQVDAIVLCPCDSKSVGTAIAKARQEGIPVFTADIACLAEGVDVVCHVASDNLGGGHAAAKAMAEVLEGEGKVAIIDYPQIESVILRVEGFKAEIVNTPGIEVVAVTSGGADKKKSADATEDLLQAHPEIDGIFAINDPSALGAAATLEKNDRADDITIVGFDAMPEGRQGVKDGKLYATITQDPVKIGRTVIDRAISYIGGEQVEKEELIPCEIYRKANADKDTTLMDKQ